jgi:DNA polymerase-3 subunit epsilon
MNDNPANGAARKPNTFVAIDFETADRSPDSACAVALVKVEDWQITERKYCLIRPPRNHFSFTYLHGISWKDVAAQPSFQELWPSMNQFMGPAAYLAAHNAEFDQSVLYACCQSARVTPPTLPFKCTVELARRVWKIYPTKLPIVCARLGIPLNHHDARSDAEACARIVIMASRGRTNPVPVAKEVR